MAIESQRRTGVEVHATTVRRWLKRLGFGFRRARPTLCIRDPNKSQRLEAIADDLADSGPDCEVFYANEADIDLNPRIGPAWMARGRQSMIPTPGQNKKHYLAGALNTRTGKVVWAERERKDSLLFIHLLYRLKRVYRRARRIADIVTQWEPGPGDPSTGALKRCQVGGVAAIKRKISGAAYRFKQRITSRLERRSEVNPPGENANVVWRTGKNADRLRRSITVRYGDHATSPCLILRLATFTRVVE